MVCILRLFLKRAPKSFSYLLWIAVAFRLVCPIAFDSSFSLLDTGIYHTVSDYIHSSAIEPELSFQNVSLSQDSLAEYKLDNRNPLYSLLVTLWLAVAAALCGYNTFSYICLKHRLIKSRKLFEPDYDYIYHSENICNKKYTIYTISGISTSFVMGVFKPVIYVPDNLTVSQARVCIAHEITHIRRCDHIVKLLASLLVCIHWFNPLVWLAFKLMSMDMEQSCDEITLRNSDLDEKKEYSKALLSIAMLKNHNNVFSGYRLGFADDSSKSRIKNILNYKKPCIVLSAVCAATVIICIAGLSVNPKDSENQLTDTDIQNIDSQKEEIYTQYLEQKQAEMKAEMAEAQKKAEEAAIAESELETAQKEAEEAAIAEMERELEEIKAEEAAALRN
jgi:beta-lactamase regulating signal transducer with metallopeptidase domain